MRANRISVARLAGAALVSISTAAMAQLPVSSPAAFAMGGNYTALARGYEAVALNPANLSSPGRPFLSLGLAPFAGTFGLDPIDVTSFYKVRGTVVDSATRAAWVNLVKLSGRERIRGDIGVTPLALSIGPIGISTGVAVATNVDMAPDVFELAVFGNGGNNGGAAKDMSLLGTEIGASMFSTGAVSFAMGLPFKLGGGVLPGEHMSIGVTGKYVMGNAFALARDLGSTLSDTGGVANLPMIFPDTIAYADDSIPSLGKGTGVDIGLNWSFGKWRIGVMAENVMNTFKWDTTKLAFIPNTGRLDPSDPNAEIDGDQQPYGNAPAALREEVSKQAFKPAITIGMAMKVTDFLTITADMHKQTGGNEAISIGPRDRFGVGAELRVIPWVPLRAGIASVTDGWQAGAGFGLRFMGLEVGVSTSIRRRGAASESGLAVGVLGLGH